MYEVRVTSSQEKGKLRLQAIIWKFYGKIQNNVASAIYICKLLNEDESINKLMDIKFNFVQCAVSLCVNFML